MDIWAYFRFTSLSVLLGFAFFCFSYATWVWRRRQGQPAEQSSRLKSLSRGWSRGLLAAGLSLAIITYAVCEIIPIRGLMRLQESFAARSRVDVEMSYLAPVGPIQKGDRLVQYQPGHLAGEVAALQAKHAKLAAELEKTESMALEIDEELTRAHQNALKEIEQCQSALNNLIPLLKETVRIGLEKRLERVDKYVVTDRYIIDYAATHKQSLSEYGLRYKELQRMNKLAAAPGPGVVTDNEFEVKQHQAISSAEQVKKLEQAIEQFRREADQLKANALEFDKLIDQQAASLGSEVNEFQAKLAAAEQKLMAAESAIAKDKVRARRQQRAEQQMVVAEMEEITATIRSLKELNEVLAPTDGTVVYRSTAPNSVEEQGVVLVMAKSDSAIVQFSLPNTQVEALTEAKTVDIWVEDSVLAKRIDGAIIDSEPSPVHAGHAIVSVACQPPMDLLPLLANEQFIAIELTWAPPLLTLPLFQLALAMIGVGGLGTLLTLPIGTQHDQAEPAVETAADVIDEPEYATLQSAQFGLHQGSSGAMLQMLGNKLRESIFACDVDDDLITSTEYALDRHQTRGLKMIRQGFLGVLTADENLEQQLDEALNSLVDRKKIDIELYDRLTRILKTLNVDAVSKNI